MQLALVVASAHIRRLAAQFLTILRRTGEEDGARLAVPAVKLAGREEGGQGVGTAPGREPADKTMTCIACTCQRAQLGSMGLGRCMLRVVRCIQRPHQRRRRRQAHTHKHTLTYLAAEGLVAFANGSNANAGLMSQYELAALKAHMPSGSVDAKAPLPRMAPPMVRFWVMPPSSELAAWRRGS